MYEKQPIILKQGNTEIELAEEDLSEEEQSFLHKLLSPRSGEIPGGRSERLLYELLVLEKNIPVGEWSRELTFPLRAVYIFLPRPLEDWNDFSEAVQAFFPESTQLLWKNTQEGILLQQADEDTEPAEAASMIDTLAADFFIRPSICIGTTVYQPADLKNQTVWETALFREVAASLPEKHVFKEQELTLYYLLHSFSRERMQTVSRILASVSDDRMLLQSVRCYLECSMNISSAAKQMYMHRNTMQYRVDKFIEKTGIDIRRFPNAAAVYLLLLAGPAGAE